jgi:hypothetical protein
MENSLVDEDNKRWPLSKHRFIKSDFFVVSFLSFVPVVLYQLPTVALSLLLSDCFSQCTLIIQKQTNKQSNEPLAAAINLVPWVSLQ